MITTVARKMNDKNSAIKTILFTSFIAGTLDMLGAIVVYCIIMKVVTPVQLLNGIASGIFGKTIIGSKTVMALIGLLFHYFIAMTFHTYD